MPDKPDPDLREVIRSLVQTNRDAMKANRNMAKMNRELVDTIERLLPQEEEAGPVGFVPTPFQRKILAALDGKALTTNALAGRVGNRRGLFKKTGLRGLIEEGLVGHHDSLGYYRKDTPPPEIRGK
jgi:hypothetical protein